MEQSQKLKKDVLELKRRIKNLEIQGAKEIALETLKLFKNYCDRAEELVKISFEIENVRPTAVVIHNVMNVFRSSPNCRTIDKLIKDLLKANERIRKHGYKLISKGSTVMVYCHSSEDLAVIKEAFDRGRIEKVYAPETRPRYQGVKTARELAEYGIETILITDNARGVFIKDVDLVMVGSDAMRKEGNVNKIGTFTLSLLAHHFKKPFYVVGDIYKLDYRKNFVIEERNPKEVVKDKKLLSMKNLTIRNPAFDITPWKYVKKVVTDKGVRTPQEIKEMLRKRIF